MPGSNTYASLAAEAVGGLSPYEPGMPPEELERRYGITGAIKLASNENPFELPESVRAAMDASLADLTRYPDGGGFVLRAWLQLLRNQGKRPAIHVQQQYRRLLGITTPKTTVR